MKVLGELVLLGLTLIMPTHSERLFASQTASSNFSTILVEVRIEGNKATYRIDSKPVPDPKPPLGQLLEKKGEDCPVIAIFSWNASLKQIYDVEVIASKVGFKTIRPFVAKNGFMSEIKFGPDIRFSRNPEAFAP